MSALTNLKQKIIVVGYAPDIAGGMTHVTRVLMKSFDSMELHPYKVCYYPAYKAVYGYLLSILRFIKKVYFYSKKHNIIVLLQIGSFRDSVRSIPYIWLSKLKGLKVCTQYHTSSEKILNERRSSLLGLLVNFALNKVDLHCFLSKSLRDRFGELYPYEFDSRIIPNPLEDKWISLPVLPKEERCRDIVFLGRWCQEKGVDDLVKCMAEVKGNMTCEFYTDHVPFQQPKNCKMFPWATESEVMDIIRTAKLVVLPSYAEAYPTVLLEAAACGTPFLASDVGGIPDIVRESRSGVGFEAGKTSLLAEAVDAMFNNDVKWCEMSRNGKAWVKTLSEERIKAMWLDTFRSLCARRYRN